jgi:hypothetical protein
LSNDIFDRIANKSKNVSKSKKEKVEKTNIDNLSNKEDIKDDIEVEKHAKKKKYKKKETEKKVQRSYYIKEKVLKNLETFCKVNNEDKSEIVNVALEKFLEEFE